VFFFPSCLHFWPSVLTVLYHSFAALGLGPTKICSVNLVRSFRWQDTAKTGRKKNGTIRSHGCVTRKFRPNLHTESLVYGFIRGSVVPLLCGGISSSILVRWLPVRLVWLMNGRPGPGVTSFRARAVGKRAVPRLPAHGSGTH
jgi:hypothetical protein